jgi:hypothetical protein
MWRFALALALTTTFCLGPTTMAQAPPSKDDLKKLEAQLDALRAQLKAAEAALKKMQEDVNKSTKPGGSTMPMPPKPGEKKPDVKKEPEKRPGGERGSWWDRLSPERKKALEERIRKWREGRGSADREGRWRHHGWHGGFGLGHHRHPGHHCHHGGSGFRGWEGHRGQRGDRPPADKDTTKPKDRPGDKTK